MEFILDIFFIVMYLSKSIGSVLEIVNGCKEFSVKVGLSSHFSVELESVLM